MFKKAVFLFVFLALILVFVFAQIVGFSPSLDLQSTTGRYLPELELLVFEQVVEGIADEAKPTATGQLDGAGVIGYVLPTTLSPATAGFDNTEGILAIAVTSHIDFDDTPMFDENQDGNYANDGEEWHSHWVVLNGDDRVKGGLSVKQFEEGDSNVVIPPTSPGLPIYLDSPGFPVVVQGGSIKVLVSSHNLKGTDFNFDGVTAYMQVNTSDSTLPLLGVYEVYDVFSGDLSLPYTVQ